MTGRNQDMTRIEPDIGVGMRASNLRTALILGGIAVVFFVGVIVKHAFFS